MEFDFKSFGIAKVDPRIMWNRLKKKKKWDQLAFWIVFVVVVRLETKEFACR